MGDTVRPSIADPDGDLAEKVDEYARETGVRRPRAWHELVFMGLQEWEKQRGSNG